MTSPGADEVEIALLRDETGQLFHWWDNSTNNSSRCGISGVAAMSYDWSQHEDSRYGAVPGHPCLACLLLWNRSRGLL